MVRSIYRSISWYSIYRSIAIPPSIIIELSEVSQYVDISSIKTCIIYAIVPEMLLLSSQLIQIKATSRWKPKSAKVVFGPGSGCHLQTLHDRWVGQQISDKRRHLWCSLGLGNGPVVILWFKAALIWQAGIQSCLNSKLPLLTLARQNKFNQVCIS